MKKLFFLFATASLLVSCNMTENIYINENGTGKFSIDMDASGMMAMMPKDSTASDLSKDIDSTFTFKSLLELKKDSISKLPVAEQEKLKKLEKFSMSTKMNAREKVFLFSIFTDFDDVSELQDAMSSVNAVQSMNKSSAASGLPISGLGDSNSELRYSYDGNKFLRKASPSKTKKTDAQKEEDDSLKMIYESSQYTLKYHFPKKVKKTNNPNALYSEDRKTITIEYPLNEYMDNPEKLNLDIEFE